MVMCGLMVDCVAEVVALEVRVLLVPNVLRQLLCGVGFHRVFLVSTGMYHLSG